MHGNSRCMFMQEEIIKQKQQRVNVRSLRKCINERTVRSMFLHAPCAKTKFTLRFYRSASTFRCAVPHEDGTTATGLVFGTHLKANIRQLVFSAYSWVDPQQNISALEGREKEQLVCVLKRKWVRFPRMK